jgi:cytochrome P450
MIFSSPALTGLQLLQTMSEMLFANLDVSTHVLSWLIIFLAENVDIQQQLREEISERPGALAELCVKKDTLLHSCFLESMRLRPFTSEIFSLAT